VVDKLAALQTRALLDEFDSTDPLNSDFLDNLGPLDDLFPDDDPRKE